MQWFNFATKEQLYLLLRRLEANSESEFSEKEDDKYADFKRFRAVPKHDEFKWDPPENLTKYTNDHFNKFIPEKDLQESILVENPVQFLLIFIQLEIWMNLWEIWYLRKELAGSLEEAANSNLVKLQQKLPDVIGCFFQGLDHSWKGKQFLFRASRSLTTWNSRTKLD